MPGSETTASRGSKPYCSWPANRLPRARLAQFAGLADGTEARTLIRRLNRWYDETRKRVSRGGIGRRVSIAVAAEVRPVAAAVVPFAGRKSGCRPRHWKLWRSWRIVNRCCGPKIEAIRGVDCGEILRQLMDRDLVRTAGRADELGRPYRYATTKRFLQVFGLRHLDDLPRAELLRRRRNRSLPATDKLLDEQSHRLARARLDESIESELLHAKNRGGMRT